MRPCIDAPWDALKKVRMYVSRTAGLVIGRRERQFSRAAAGTPFKLAPRNRPTTCEVMGLDVNAGG